MKAVVYYKNGGPEVFEYTDVDIPAVGQNEVLIKNEYISIAGGDLIAREIMPPERVPHVVGYQCAGEIVEIGAQVRNRSTGQKVVTLVPSGSHAAWGSHAEYTVTPADMTWVVPANMSLDIASAIPVVFGKRTNAFSSSAISSKASQYSFMRAPARSVLRPCSSRGGRVHACSRPHRMTQSWRA